MTIRPPNKIEIEKTGDTWMWHAFGKDGEVLNARVGMESKDAAYQSIGEVYGSMTLRVKVKE